MRLVTWNINSIRLRINLLRDFVEMEKPDIICLQEIKTINTHFPIEAVNNMGYPYVIFAGEKSYNGVAILAKYPIENSFSLNLYNDDKRHIAGQIKGIEVHNFYVPAGGDEPSITSNPKFKHKLEFVSLMRKWFNDNRSLAAKIVLAGDLNIAPNEHDVWSSKQLRNVVSHTDIERKYLTDLKDSFSFIDTGRHFVGLEKKLYSWWSYRNRDWEKSDRGRRLDHIWVSANMQSMLKRTVNFKEVRNWLRPSDHIPVLLEIG